MSTATLHSETNKLLVPKLRFNEFDGEWKNSKLSKFATLNPKNGTLPESFIYIDLESVTDGFLIKENSIFKSEAPSRAQRILSKKDILFQTVRPYQKNNLFFNRNGDYVASTGYAQIRTENDPKFLFQFLHTEKFVTNVMLRCTGTSYPAINSTDLAKIEIFSPIITEQQKIASFLSEVDEKIQQLTRKATLLEQYKKGVMQQLFSRKLRFKDDNEKDYPNWEEKKLGDLGIFKGGGTPSTNISEYWDGDIPWISSSDLIENDISNINVTRFITEKAISESATKLIPVNSVLFISRVGVGKLAVNKRIICTSQDFANFIPNKIDSFYLAYYFIKNNNLLSNYAQGTSIKGFTSGDLKSIKVSYPIIEEQQKIANFLSNIDNKIEKTNQQIRQTQNFKKGLLQQMFV